MINGRALVIILFVGLSKTSGLKNYGCKGVIGFSSFGVNKIHPSGLISFKKDLFDSGHGWVRETGTLTVSCPGVYSVSFTGHGNIDTRFILKKRAGMNNSTWEPLISTLPGGSYHTLLLNLHTTEQITVTVSTIAGNGVSNIITYSDQFISVSSFTAHRIDT